MIRHLNELEQLFFAMNSKMIVRCRLKLENHKINKDIFYNAYQTMAWKHPMLRVNVFLDEQKRPYWKEIKNYMPDFTVTEAKIEPYLEIPNELLSKYYIKNGVDGRLVNIDFLVWEDEAYILLEGCHTIMDGRCVNLIFDELVRVYVEFYKGKLYDISDQKNKPYPFPDSPIYPQQLPQDKRKKLDEIIQSKKEHRDNYTYKLPRPLQETNNLTKILKEGSAENLAQLKAYCKSNKISIGSCLYAASFASVALMARDYKTNERKDTISITALVPLEQTQILYSKYNDIIVMNLELFDFNISVSYSSTLLELADQISKKLKAESVNYGLNYLSMINYSSKNSSTPYDVIINLVPSISEKEYSLSELEKLQIQCIYISFQKKYTSVITNSPNLIDIIFKDQILFSPTYPKSNEKIGLQLTDYNFELTENFPKYAKKKISSIDCFS